ncbi:MAG TPA: precorrin-3B C(17)-methyltransferase [Acidimicrobiales bacterium]|nr:precorrin-3B C(17)-methyltransferase [Acidimicrobiales bacterium]
MKVVSISVTERGRSLASRLPFEQVHGKAGSVVRDRWNSVDGFVLFLAAGAAVRIIAPLLTDKDHDPAVVCVDEAGRWAVSLCGGHAGRANQLTRQVAALLDAEPVVTTASDAIGQAGLDVLPDLTAIGDVAGVAVALLDGRRVAVDNPLGWPLPAVLASRGPTALVDGPRVMVTDLAVEPGPATVVLHPASLVVGIGASAGAPLTELEEILAAALAEGGLARASLGEVATLDRKAAEPAIVALGLPMRTFRAEQLAAVEVPTPSAVVDAAVGTPSVAEAAALAAAGPGATLLVTKRKGAHVTVAVARRRCRRGHLSVVGLGPGGPEHRTPAATAAVARAELVIGYGPYLDQCRDAVGPDADVIRSEIGDESGRAGQALSRAADGQRVALVCSGDAGIYAMAALVFERCSEHPSLDPGEDITVVPGVTAALASAALLGAPLGHDHVAISLSDLLTPWNVIERRLAAAGEADLVVSLYNPRSLTRTWQLEAAKHMLLAHRAPETPVGIVHDAGRSSQSVNITTLGALDATTVGMTSCVIIGSSTTRVIGDRLVTPRGYQT